MGQQPDLAALRQLAAVDRPGWLDQLAVLAGLALMARTAWEVVGPWLIHNYRAGPTDLLGTLLVLTLAFMVGSIATYSLYWAARTVLYLTRAFWWVFVLAAILGFWLFPLR
jgi:hypothetical protein